MGGGLLSFFPHQKLTPYVQCSGTETKAEASASEDESEKGFCLDHKERWVCGPASSSVLTKQSAAITGWLHSLTPTQPGAGCGLCDG